jgi:hypothetical protein
MATERQVRAAKQNVKKAQKGAREQRTLAHLPQRTRKALGEQAAKGRARGGAPGHSLEDRNRQQIYETAREMGIEGRSKMGKWELIEAIRARR